MHLHLHLHLQVTVTMINLQRKIYDLDRVFYLVIIGIVPLAAPLFVYILVFAVIDPYPLGGHIAWAQFATYFSGGN